MKLIDLRVLSLGVLLAGAPGCFLAASDDGGGGSRRSDLPSARAQQVVAGRQHACALTTTGGVRCWGYVEHGALGDGSPLGGIDRKVAVQVTGLEAGVTAIASGPSSDFSCAVVGGGVKCWGDNSDGQLGDGTREASAVPVNVAGVSGATALAVGTFHACALVAGGAVSCWGKNEDGGLGDRTTTSSTRPVAVAGVTGATSIAAGQSHTCAVVGGKVLCWGGNLDGEAGGPEDTYAVEAATAVAGLAGATRVWAGGRNTCAVTSGGAASCWGDNADGQLGDGMGGDGFAQSALPVAVSGLGAGVTSLGLGSAFAVAVASGRAKVWGEFAMAETATPTEGPTLPDAATAIAAGGGFACALGSSGAVWCWGENDSGAVGYYDTNSGVHYEPAPLAISSLP